MTRKLSEGISSSTERKFAITSDAFERFMTARSRFFPADITATDMVEFKAGVVYLEVLRHAAEGTAEREGFCSLHLQGRTPRRDP